MFSTTHRPHPRCQVICRNPDTGETLQCARWQGHTQEAHYSYSHIIEAMCIRLANKGGYDSPDDMKGTAALVILTVARSWYKRLVL